MRPRHASEKGFSPVSGHTDKEAFWTLLIRLEVETGLPREASEDGTLLHISTISELG